MAPDTAQPAGQDRVPDSAACNCDASGDPPTGHRPWCGTEPLSDLYWQGYHEAQQRLDDANAPSKAELDRLIAVVDEWAMGYRDGLRGVRHAT